MLISDLLELLKQMIIEDLKTIAIWGPYDPDNKLRIEGQLMRTYYICKLIENEELPNE